jgi:glycogen debranching enzyme
VTRPGRPDEPLEVGFLHAGPRPEALSEEERAAWEELRRAPGLSARAVPFDSCPEAAAGCAVLWWHSTAPDPPEAARRALPALRRHLDAGGGVFLSLLAAPLVVELGLESVAPDHVEAGPRAWSGDPIEGLQAFEDHPAFRGLHGGGVFLWNPCDGDPAFAAEYRERRPREGRVVAVARRYLEIDPSRRLMVEYQDGRVLTAGANLRFHRGGRRFEAHRRRFLGNVLRAVSGRVDGDPPRSWWPPLAAPRVIAAEVAPGGPPPVPDGFPDPAGAELRLEAPPGSGAPFTLAGRRMLLVGDQSGRIEEAWSLPARILRELRFAVLPGPEAPASFAATPEAVEVWRAGPSWRARLALYPALEAPGFVAAFELEATGSVEIEASFTPDLTALWPRPDGSLGDLHVGVDAAAGAVAWRDARGRFHARAGFSRAPERIEASGRIAVRAGPGREVLAFAVAGGLEEEAGVRRLHRELLAGPVAALSEARENTRRVLHESLELETPEPALDEAVRWAKVAVDRFRAEAPGTGRGLLAGYRATRPGWNRARPGYAWHFGRDSAWVGLGLLGAGDAAPAREALEQLARFQDVDGKVFHELMPGAGVHYDAADATPLFVILLERWLRRTGDEETARRLAPAARAALEFCLSTDTDGDGLIENTGVGHGWIEGGRFHGAHVSLYLAGLWAEALRAAAGLCPLWGDPERAPALRAHAARVREALNRDFWNEADRGFFHGKRADGTFQDARTVLPAVPLLFGLLDAERCGEFLRWLASSEVTTDWGVRLVERSHPDYDPRGYHEGSVWPLFTGWAALAEYRAGRAAQGFAHVMASARLHRLGNLGRFPEVLDGERCVPAGVCPDQAWSASLLLQAVAEGMLGIDGDARAGRLELAPALPGSWERAAFRGVRLGRDLLDLECARAGRRHEYRLVRREGRRPLDVRLRPWFPPGSRGGGEAVVRLGAGAAEATFLVDRAPAAEPPATAPAPGAADAGLRLIDEEHEAGARWTVTVEGRAGRAYELEVRDVPPGWRPDSGELARDGSGRARLRFTLDGAPGATVRRAIAFR